MASNDSSHELAKAADRLWSMLNELSDSDPEQYKKFISQQLKDGADSVAPPEAVFCFSCSVKLQKKDHKLFVNVCKWTAVPRPKSDSDPVPAKGGKLRHIVRDGTRKSQLLFEVGFNPYVIKECTQNSVLEQMLVSLTLDFTAEFTGLAIDKQTVKKLAVPFKGPKQELHWSLDDSYNHLLPKEGRLDIGESLLKEIRRLKSNQTEENGKQTSSSIESLASLKLTSSPTNENARKLIEEIPSGKQCLTKPKHSVGTITKEGRKAVQVTVSLDGLSSVKDVEVDMSENDLCISGGQYHLEIDLPCKVNEESIKAQFNSRTATLLISAFTKK